jgi:four helix bundle protein
VSDFKELKVWQKAHELMLRTHQLLDTINGRKFAPRKTQMRRSAESIPANIVESRGHESAKEAARFLRIGLNSATELEYHLLVAFELRAVTREEYTSLTDRVIEVRKMLYGLIRYLIASGRFAAH